MFDSIKAILNEISQCPNVYVSQTQDIVIEPIQDSINLSGSQIKINDYFRYLKFAIVKKQTCFDRVIYKAICKENNPEEYLKSILDDLKKIKANYFKIDEV